MEQSLDNDLVKCIYEGLDMKHTEPSQLSPLVLAYIGDSIYDLVIKTWVIEQGNMQVNKLNKKTSSIVKAESQSAMIGVIEPMLSEHEEAVYKRDVMQSHTHQPRMQVSEITEEQRGLRLLWDICILAGSMSG